MNHTVHMFMEGKKFCFIIRLSSDPGNRSKSLKLICTSQAPHLKLNTGYHNAVFERSCFHSSVTTSSAHVILSMYVVALQIVCMFYFYTGDRGLFLEVGVHYLKSRAARWGARGDK